MNEESQYKKYTLVLIGKSTFDQLDKYENDLS